MSLFAKDLRSKFEISEKKKKVDFVNYRKMFLQNNFLNFLLRETTMK